MISAMNVFLPFYFKVTYVAKRYARLQITKQMLSLIYGHHLIHMTTGNVFITGWVYTCVQETELWMQVSLPGLPWHYRMILLQLLNSQQGLDSRVGLVPWWERNELIQIEFMASSHLLFMVDAILKRGISKVSVWYVAERLVLKFNKILPQYKNPLFFRVEGGLCLSSFLQTEKNF